ncbi:MAG: UDP-N-acetylmuramoylalanine--D-glutamate ligase [Myxococcota bacterium]|jgi:UDP-N-acetylmuramoylalanine--D-glutamate ligase
MNDLRDKTVVVVGLGVSGRAAATLALAKGAQVVGLDQSATCTPMDGVRLVTGELDTNELLAADLILVSPGIAAAHPALVQARKSGVEMVGELAFAARFATVPIVAVTGTNGKSTVTWFTQQLLAAAGFNPFVGGNLGRAACEAVDSDHDVWVLEVSSYQLELADGFQPSVAVVLNLTPDHLGRHGDMVGYAQAKTDIFRSQVGENVAVLPISDDRLSAAASRYPLTVLAHLGGLPGVKRTGGMATVEWGNVRGQVDLSGLTVPGEHNKDNAATALLLAIALGASLDAVAAAVPSLTGLAHRMEIVADAGGVLVINDSKATNIDAARTGLVGLDRPAVVLLGGESKGRGFAELAPLLIAQRAVITFGQDGPAIADELVEAGVAVVRVGSMEDALDRAMALATSGDAILLSPGCASFDAYRNFAHRGDVFRTLVHDRFSTEALP